MKWRCHKCAVIISSVTLSSSLSSTIMMMINHCPGEDIAAVVTFAVPLFCWAQECGVTEIGWMGICTNVQWHQGSKLRTRCCGKTEEILISAHAWVPFHASFHFNLHQQDVFLSSMSYFVQNVFLCSNNNIVVFSKKLHSCPTTSFNAANVQENFRSLGLQWVLSFVSTMSFEANRYNIIPISLASTFERFVECFLLVQKQNGNWIQNRAQMLKRFSVPSFSLPPVTWLLLCVNNSKNLTLDPTMKRLQGAGSKLWAFASGGCFLNPDTNNNSDTVAFNSLGGGR